MASESAYIENTFLLTLPILLWNLLFADMLPAAFQPDTYAIGIPGWIRLGEQGSRILFFIVTYLMPLNRRAPWAIPGLLIYFLGALAYFASWAALVIAPHSAWAGSFIGFTAPAWTPAIWMAGICLTGHRFSFGLVFHRCVPIMASLLFLAFHVSQAAMAYNRQSTARRMIGESIETTYKQ